MKIGETMYKASAAEQAAEATAQAGGASAAGAGHGKPDEKVVDAEFEEVDENKKKSA